MKQKLLIGVAFCGSLFMFNSAYGQTCTAIPSCTELGYTKTQSECGEDGIKCPFGNLWSCRDVKCKIGDIYYSDIGCRSDVISGKTALGVVVYLDATGKHGQVMSAWPVDREGNKSDSNVYSSMYWAYFYDSYYDIAALPNYNPAESAATDFNSCSNTDKILADTQTTYPAARAARLYAPTNETKGKWCLPAAGVMTSIYMNQSAVQDGIRILGGVTYPDCCTWSSSELNSSWTWGSDFSYINGLDGKLKDTSYDENYHSSGNYHYAVRPVLEF